VPRISIYRIEADGVKVFYLEVGPARAPVVLLLHGFRPGCFSIVNLVPLKNQSGSRKATVGNEFSMTYSANFSTSALDENGNRPVIANFALP
jgi:hypothetical protein